MDKLKQVLKYQFWILLGIALILPLIGWGAARSGYVAEATKRTGDLKKKDSDLRFESDDPNSDWQTKLKAVNTAQQSELNTAWQELYDRQVELMTWPRNVDPAKLEKKADTMASQEVYRGAYSRIWEETRKVVRPNDLPHGLIDVSEMALPRNDGDWTQAPSPDQIIAAQEDIWLMKSLLEAINRVNEGANSPIDAPVRAITQLVLRGGTEGGDSSAAAGGAGGAPTGGMGSPLGMDGGNMPRQMAGGRGGSQGASAEGVFDSNASFNPDDELGAEQPDTSADSGSQGGGASPTSATMGMTPGMSMPGMGMPGSGGAGGKMKRYIHDKTEWKTRGFYLEVVMEHQQLPKLLVELTNATWPVRVARVQQADFREEDLVHDSSGGFAGGMTGAGIPGAGMPGGMGMMGAAGAAGRPPMGGMPRSMPGMPSMAGASMAGANRGMPAMGGAGVKRPQAIGIGGGRRGGDDDDGGGRPAGILAPGMIGPGMTNTGSNVSALEDPNLANIAIDGWIVIFKKPPEPTEPPANQALPETPAPGQSLGEQPGAVPAAAAGAGQTPAAGVPGASAEVTSEAEMEATGPEATGAEAIGESAEPASDEAPAESEPAGETPPDKGAAPASEPAPSEPPAKPN